ncbi:83_t:CDS:2 [Dentiscutata erythropus]|uniref:83_t:CDS:1 n=1 Tax=Dentiscutata erythropus TaxID=1348616 RepID=A0A9N9EBJ6_9GLOM|nr:83_t:CDS:2 [Dentiscutata erythropus]
MILIQLELQQQELKTFKTDALALVPLKYKSTDAQSGNNKKVLRELHKNKAINKKTKAQNAVNITAPVEDTKKSNQTANPQILNKVNTS